MYNVVRQNYFYKNIKYLYNIKYILNLVLNIMSAIKPIEYYRDLIKEYFNQFVNRVNNLQR